MDDFNLYIKAVYDEFTYNIIKEAVNLLNDIDPDFEDTVIFNFLNEMESKDVYGNKSNLENYLVERLMERIELFYIYINRNYIGFESIQPLTELLAYLNVLDEHPDPEFILACFTDCVDPSETIAELVNEVNPLTSIERYMEYIEEVSPTFIKNQKLFQKERLTQINRDEDLQSIDSPALIAQRNKVRYLLERFDCPLIETYFEEGGDVGLVLQTYIDSLFTNILLIGDSPESIESIAEHLIVLQAMSQLDWESFMIVIMPLIPDATQAIRISKTLLKKREGFNE